MEGIFRSTLILSSVLSLVSIFVVGVAFIPTKRLIDFTSFGESLTVLNAVIVRFAQEPVFTFGAWIGPLLLAPFIPNRYLSPAFAVMSTCIGILMLLMLCNSEQRRLFLEMLTTLPHSGYMWHDVFVIALSSLIVQPTAFWLILLGPGAVTCVGAPTTSASPMLLILIAFTSLITIIPTAVYFVDDSGSMFIPDFPADNIAGQMLNYSMVFAFVKTYHLISRSAYIALRRYTSLGTRFMIVIWMFTGTALVELWGCSAWILHLAFVSFMRIDVNSELETATLP